MNLDKRQMLEHLRALRHRSGEVTQIYIERWTETKEDEQRLRKNRTPLRWTGLYEPGRYDELTNDVLQFFREHEGVVFNVYVGVNPRTLAVLPYADHSIRSYMDIARDERTPRYPNGSFVIRRGILFDLDHKPAKKGNPRPKGNPALVVARELRDRVPELQQASLFNTGNNAALVAHLPDGDFADDAIKAFFTEVAAKHDLVPPEGKAGVKLDPTSDGYHIMGLAGTPKRKGADPSKWPDQTVEVVGEESPILAAAITRFAHEFKAKVAAKPKASSKARTPRGTPAERQLGLDIDDAMASWCTGYHCLWVEGVEDDRSRVLFNLTVKMVWSGWQEDDIERALRVWSAHKGYERSDKWYRHLVTSAQGACEKGVVPSHKTLVAMLGSCPCKGGCELDQAATAASRGKLLELEWEESKSVPLDRALPMGLPLKAAREDQTVYMKQAIQFCAGEMRAVRFPPQATPDPTDSPERPILCVVTGPPGVGKTHAARALTRRRRVAWFFDRKEEFKKLDTLTRRRGDIAVRPIRSRADLCIVDDSRGRLKEMGDRGLSVAGGRICKTCSVQSTCPYTTQFDGIESISVAAASSWGGTARAKELVQHAELILFDEDMFEAAFQKATITKKDLPLLRHVAKGMRFGDAPVRLVAALEDLLSLPSDTWKQIQTEDAGLRRWLIGRLNAPSGWPGKALSKWAAAEKSIRQGLDVERLPAAELASLAEAIHAAARDLKAPCPMFITSRHDQGGRALVQVSFTPITLNKPGLVLDATGDIEIYQQLFPNHEVYEDPTAASIQAQVIQICDQRLPMETLHHERNRKQVFGIIHSLAQARVREMNGGRVLVVGRHALMEELEHDDAIVTTYFGGQRGSRDFEKLHTAIIVGTPEPPVEQMAAYAEAMLGTAVSRNRLLVKRPYNLPVPGKQNRSYGVMVPVYEDKLLQRIVERVREGELVQAGYRIRPLDLTPRSPDLPRQNLKIYLLTNIPLRLLPPTEVPITLAELEALAKGK